MRLKPQAPAVLALGAAGVMPQTPVTKTQGVRAVTVATGSAGFVPVGGDSTSLMAVTFSDRGLLARLDGVRLVAALAIMGLSAEITSTLAITRSSRVDTG